MQFISLQLCCGYYLRIQKWLVYAKQLQPRNPGTLRHFSISILKVLHRCTNIREFENVTDQMRPDFKQRQTWKASSKRKLKLAHPCCCWPRISWNPLNSSSQYKRWSLGGDNLITSFARWVGPHIKRTCSGNHLNVRPENRREVSQKKAIRSSF